MFYLRFKFYDMGVQKEVGIETLLVNPNGLMRQKGGKRWNIQFLAIIN